MKYICLGYIDHAKFAALPQAGRRWTVVVTGDHGDGLGDHGEATHGLTLYREVVEVPLVLHPKPARFVDPGEGGSLADIAPTLCAIAGVRCADADRIYLVGDIVDAQAKAHHLVRLRDELGLRKEQVIAVGDGANDLMMMAEAGVSIAWRAKPIVRAQATHALNYAGLDGVIHLLD